MKDDGLIPQYLEKLAKSDEPHYILASIYCTLFNKRMEPVDWGQLRRLINIYGRWIVLEAILRSSLAELDFGKNIWAYFNVVCVTLIGQQKESFLIEKAAEDRLKETRDYIESLVNNQEKIILEDDNI